MSSPSPRFHPFVLTLGFALGVAFGWLAFAGSAAPRPPAPASPPGERRSPEPGDRLRDAGSLAGIEQVFERWGGYCVWERDRTEIAVWSQRRQRHSDFYEVLRVDGYFYFRRIPVLTRPLIDHGTKAVLPAAFTEPRWRREQFYRDHPDYDRTLEPIVDLPPKPPERFAPGTEPNNAPAHGLPQLTPGVGP